MNGTTVFLEDHKRSPQQNVGIKFADADLMTNQAWMHYCAHCGCLQRVTAKHPGDVFLGNLPIPHH